MRPGASPHPALSRKRERVPDRVLSTWLAVGWVAVALLPWHALEDGVFAAGALAGYPWSAATAPALFALAGGQFFLLPLLLPLVAASFRLAAPLDASPAAWLAVRGAVVAVGGVAGVVGSLPSWVWLSIVRSLYGFFGFFF